ncbi:alpha/beta fold hydrolase [Sciscionella sediminilitoris]|uniref:alpha/beta fold hydrolase n=1 Tax=Sciscionella sediminilitoris TaxID=1445613 RepID=UPI0004DF9774|nr:alpha/beta hydrolase [Sciscionella sp. SE31]
MAGNPVYESGSGRPVLVLHGAPGPQGARQMVDHLAGVGHVYAPTHPGWEDVPLPEGEVSVPALARRYRELLAELRLEDVLVVGTSFGGWIAAELVAQDASAIRGLVLVDSVGIEIPEHPLRMPEGLPLLDAYGKGALTDATLGPRLAGTTVPSLVIWGEDDPIAPLPYGKAVAASLPGATFVPIAGAGHVPYRDAPEEVWAALDRFAG